MNRTKTKKELSEDWIILGEEDNGQSSEPKLFLNEFLEENQVKFPFVSEIRKVWLSKKGTGYCIETEHFIEFLWKKDKRTKMLIEALAHFINEGQGNLLALCLQESDVQRKTEASKPKVTIIANKKEKIIWYGSDDGKKYSVYPLTELEEYITGEQNPLI